MAATSENRTNGGDEVRRLLARSRALGEDMRRSGDAVVYHLRRAAEYRRQAARAARRNGRP